PVLVRPCTISDGIIQINPNEFDSLLKMHSEAAEEGRLMKFVPASGAASRMFQKLLSVLSENDELDLIALKKLAEEDKNYKAAYDLLTNINQFAFYDDIKAVLKVNDSKLNEIISNQPFKVLKVLLFEHGLNYASKPKGAIKFHKYENENRTAFEEHIYESINYLLDNSKQIKIHFTISEEHQGLFTNIIDEFKKKLKKDLKLIHSHSFQKKSTDTVAVNEDNEILFDKTGNIIMRPGGHGALIENLNDLNADIVIIKNIDNLSVEPLAEETVFYKKLLTGYLIQIQNQVFKYLRTLDNCNPETVDLEEIINFCKDKIFINTPAEFNSYSGSEKVNFLYKKLNRPIRVCGMVKNEGEPGGGPFWVKEDDGTLSLQIIEQAQINLNDEQQKKIFKGSTHFNPVDLVCGLRDYKGKNFNLHNFIDHQSGIITQKSKDGIQLKALELPGLWNGAMADWITVFIEVQISTFNPVKEINDLLRKQHQN
ncbi:MAG TPA: DUF4301 family protein, partial [Ignavibacteriaceae bacterium]|nr:DUF4301 family protein [Ignavibacteriaceae bacterium]